jgi:hypothetical protein
MVIVMPKRYEFRRNGAYNRFKFARSVHGGGYYMHHADGILGCALLLFFPMVETIGYNI